MFNTTITQPYDAIHTVKNLFIITRFSLAIYSEYRMIGSRTRSRQYKE